MAKSLKLDIEATGLGKEAGQAFARPVGIWQIAYAIDDQKPVSLFGKTNIPFEPGALRIHGSDIIDGKPGLYARRSSGLSEKELLQKFGAVLLSNKDLTIEGYNVKGFDVPALAQAFKRHGLTKELEALNGLKVEDLLETSKDFLLKALPSSSLAQLYPGANSTYLRGTKLENMAAGFGIPLDPKRLHDASYDLELLDQVTKSLRDQTKEFNIVNWARSVDESMSREYSGMPRGRTFEQSIKVAKRKDPNADKANFVDRAQLHKTQYIIGMMPDVKRAQEMPTLSMGLSEKVRNLKLGEKAGQAIDWASKNQETLKTAGKVGAVLLGGAYVYRAVKEFKMRGDEDEYVSATSLGKSDEEIRRAILKSDNVAAFNKAIERSGSGESFALKMGKQVGTMIEKEFGKDSRTVGIEVPLVDHELGVKGRADIIMELDGVKIPIDPKAVSTEEVLSKEQVDYEYASQVNFYSHKLGSPGGYIMYVSKEDPSIRRTFWVPYSASRLVSDVARFREQVIQNRDTPGVLLGWSKQSEEFLGGMPQYTPPHNMSKIRDQATRNSYLFPIGTPNHGNYDRRSNEPR